MQADRELPPQDTYYCKYHVGSSRAPSYGHHLTNLSIDCSSPYLQSLETTPFSLSARLFMAPGFMAASMARSKSTKTSVNRTVPGIAFEYTSNRASVRSLKFCSACKSNTSVICHDCNGCLCGIRHEQSQTSTPFWVITFAPREAIPIGTFKFVLPAEPLLCMDVGSQSLKEFRCKAAAPVNFPLSSSHVLPPPKLPQRQSLVKTSSLAENNLHKSTWRARHNAT